MQAEHRLGGRTVFEGRLVQVRVDTVRLPSGRQATREVVEHGPVTVVVPIDEDGNVIMVRQFRYPIGSDLLEAPAGGFEESETPEECAMRELREETGYSARSLEPIGRFWPSPGHSTELIHAFVARDLVADPLEADPDEDVRTERVPLTAVKGMVQRGEIQDAKTIAALLMVICLAD